MTKPKWVVSPFSSEQHQRENFSCGHPALDTYIRQLASQDVKRKMARVFVACDVAGNEIKGYYTLSAAGFRKEDLPSEIAKKLPHYPVPAAILGRLAVDRSCHGQGLGKFLLMDCINRVVSVSHAIGIFAVIADAKDEAAKAFYERYGFRPFTQQPLKLLLTLATIEKAPLP